MGYFLWLDESIDTTNAPKTVDSNIEYFICAWQHGNVHAIDGELVDPFKLLQ